MDGQVQDWFLARFLGTDGDVDIATDHPEFSALEMGRAATSSPS